MPALQIPCDKGIAHVLVDSGIITVDGKMYTEAFYRDPLGDSRYKALTPAEFRAVPWKRIISSRFVANYLRIRISIYGMDLSEQVRDVSVIHLYKEVTQSVPRLMCVRHSPRLRWIGKYEELKERRTAVAMASHKRLGRGSLLAILSADTIQMVMAMASE